MKQNFNFQTDSKINVFVTDPDIGTKFFGEIRLINNKHFILEFKYDQSDFLQLRRFLNNCKTIYCQSEFTSYTIIDFFLEQTEVYIESIIQGEFKNKTTGVRISLTGITDWATSFKDKSFQIQKQLISKSFSESNIEEKFTFKNKPYVFRVIQKINFKSLRVSFAAV